MSGDHDPTDPDAPVVNVPDGVVSGESSPPDEHTLRVRARSRQKAPATNLEVHDQTKQVPAQRSSTEMADVSRRHRRRDRDKRAERRAIQWLVGLFVGIGGATLLAVNVLLDDSKPTDRPPPLLDENGEQVVVPPPPSGVISTTIDETPDIPAVRHLQNEGLTIVAEGLPQVDAIGMMQGNAALAALETCRFAYAVWEFSPNKRFRFLTTCNAMEGQVMFGAYEVVGGVVRMSPLITDTDAVISEFHVGRPSKMISRVSRAAGSPSVLKIDQRVTNMRPGLDGDRWRDAFSAKNTINLPTGRQKAPPPRRGGPPPPSGPAKQKKSSDPLLDLLKKNG